MHIQTINGERSVVFTDEEFRRLRDGWKVIFGIYLNTQGTDLEAEWADGMLAKASRELDDDDTRLSLRGDESSSAEQG